MIHARAGDFPALTGQGWTVVMMPLQPQPVLSRQPQSRADLPFADPVSSRQSFRPKNMRLPSLLSGGLALALLLPLTALGYPDTPISSVPVGLDHDPGGNGLARGQTDAKGQVTFPNLAPGNYVASFVEVLPAPDRVGHAGSGTNPTQQKAAINTSRSNKKHSNISVMLGGGQAKSTLQEARHTVDWGNEGQASKVHFTVPAGPARSITLTLSASDPGPAQKINSTLQDVSTTR
jgi:hypothetical protein